MSIAARRLRSELRPVTMRQMALAHRRKTKRAKREARRAGRREERRAAAQGVEPASAGPGVGL